MTAPRVGRCCDQDASARHAVTRDATRGRPSRLMAIRNAAGAHTEVPR